MTLVLFYAQCGIAKDEDGEWGGVVDSIGRPIGVFHAMIPMGYYSGVVPNRPTPRVLTNDRKYP